MSHFPNPNSAAGVPLGYLPPMQLQQQMLPYDPNIPWLTAAVNRLAAALETFNAGRAPSESVK